MDPSLPASPILLPSEPSTASRDPSPSGEEAHRHYAETNSALGLVLDRIDQKAAKLSDVLFAIREHQRTAEELVREVKLVLQQVNELSTLQRSLPSANGYSLSEVVSHVISTMARATGWNPSLLPGDSSENDD